MPEGAITSYDSRSGIEDSRVQVCRAYWRVILEKSLLEDTSSHQVKFT